MATLKDYLRKLFEYDHWANLESLGPLRRVGNPSARAIELLAHVIAAEWLWNDRLTSASQTFAVWPAWNLDECEAHLEELPLRWKKFFEHLTESHLESSVTYKNSKGEEWSSSVADILTHTTLHSAYHRGQIASAMRSEDLTPAYTDYIHCVRTGKL